MGWGMLPVAACGEPLQTLDLGFWGKSLSRLGNKPEHLMGGSTMIGRIATRNFFGDMPESEGRLVRWLLE